MAEPHERLAELDPVWAQLVIEAEQAVKDEPLLVVGAFQRALSRDTGAGAFISDFDEVGLGRDAGAVDSRDL